jgi:multiple sugar transport system substrate-binding protein
VRESLYEGMTIFDGRIYSFPIFSPRQHATTLWYNEDMVTAAGVDPEADLRTWEGVREAAQAMTSGRTYGILLPIQFAARMGEHVQDLAEIAGAPGPIDWRTGEYAYGTQPYVDAIEFLLSFQEDGSLHPASSSLDARNGRARWAAGEAALFFDGPWNSGVLNNNFPEVIDVMNAAGIPVRSLDDQAYTYNSPSGGVFWISSQSEHPEVASAILQNFTSDEYYLGLAQRMDQPPLDLSAVDRADVHPVYKKVISNFLDVVRIAPEPVIKNPNVALVAAEMRSISPNLGEIVQGAFSGAIPNLQATLQTYADQLTAERERAIQVVQGRGLEVSVDDWIFPNWQPGVDYTAEQYE